VTGSGWQYRNRAGLQGVTKMAIRRAGSNPGLLTVSVTGKNGSFPVTPSQVPPRFTIVVEGTLGLHGQCGEAVFGGPTLSSFPRPWSRSSASDRTRRALARPARPLVGHAHAGA